MTVPRIEDESSAALIERLAKALTLKALSLPESGFTKEEWVECIVATTVADTWLVLTDAVPLEAYEI